MASQEKIIKKLNKKAEDFLKFFPHTLFTYIGDYNSALPIIHSEALDLDRQDSGYGIFFTVNGFTGGKRSNETLTNVNAFFVDIDYPDKMNRTTDSVNAYKNEVLMECYNHDFVPTFINETKNGLHIFWCLENPIYLQNLNVEQQELLRVQYRQIEEAIIKKFDGDPGAKDISRVLRVPYTLHQKDKDDPFEIKIAHHSEMFYKFSDLREFFLKKDAPDEWAVAQGENPLNADVKNEIEKLYPKLSRPSYQNLFDVKTPIPEGMRNKALLVAAYAAKETGWSYEQTCEHFREFHGLGLREIRRTIQSAFEHNYDFGYNNEVMQALVTPEERSELSKTTSKVLAKSTKEERAISNNQQKERYHTYEYVIAERHPYLKYKEKGDFYDYNNGFYSSMWQSEVQAMIFREMFLDGLTNYRKVSAINDKIAAFKSLDGRTFTHKDENPNPNILNFKNGLLDIDTYALSPHTPEYLSTSQIPIEYKYGTSSPLWFKFLNDIMDGDQDQIKLLQQIAGYCLTVDTKFAKAFIFFGSGANGKSLFNRMISKFIGPDAVSSLNLTTITKQFGLTGLIGKKLNLIDEISGNYFESNIIKNIISGEKLAADIKYRPEPLEFIPSVKLIFSVNELPKINDTTPGLYRRFIIVPFERSFLLNPDLDLERKLTTELPGILNWAIEGLKSLRDDGRFNETEKNFTAMNAYKAENSPLLEFLMTTYEATPDSERYKYGTALSSLYSEYRQYSLDSGYKPKSLANLSRELSHLHMSGWKIEKKKEGVLTMIYGIRKLKNLGGDEIVYRNKQTW